ADVCGSIQTDIEYNGWTRYDNSVAVTSPAYCRQPSDAQARWYFSYVSNEGFFIRQDVADTHRTVVTMSYKTSSVDALPVMADATTQEKITEMTAIVRTLILK
ncbi:MAG TPA: hypothetical protein PKL83_00980, partial [bacterium]|nr:hypothetical protein [bacterium]